MSCHLLSTYALETPIDLKTFIRVFNILVAMLNIIGNALLVWGLFKTGQYRSISFHFIIMMSTSDLISGIYCLTMLSLATWEAYNKICWIRVATQVILSTCNYISVIMIALIAVDRYLHVRYLERYPLVVTRRRGYIVVILCLVYVAIINTIFLLPMLNFVHDILQLTSLFALFPFWIVISLLYHSAVRRVRTVASRLVQDTASQTRALSRAAKNIMICIVVLTLPLLTIQVLKLINKSRPFLHQSLSKDYIWIAYITFLSNAFCSSVIFMSQNRPIRLLLRKVAGSLCNFMSSTVEPASV